MIDIIRRTIEKKLRSFIDDIDKTYSLHDISPLLFRSIKEFVLRPCNRFRPILFVIGYLGFSRKPGRNLYTSALAIELLHDFMLVHDDIIDKSDTRRGKPSMHAKFNAYLSRQTKVKFNGQDLALIAGVVMYAMAIDSFLSIQELPQRKEKALRNFIINMRDSFQYPGLNR